MKSLIDRLNANFILISLPTPEESRAELVLTQVAAVTKRSLFRWSMTQGLRRLCGAEWAPTQLEGGDPAAAARVLGGEGPVQERALVVFLDFSPYLKDPIICRTFRDAIPNAREKLITGVFLGPTLELPAELKREVAEVELPLPDETEIGKVIEATVEANKGLKGLETPKGEKLARLIESARGLTVTELENALALSLVGERAFSPKVVSGEKGRAVKASGALEVQEPPPGGLDAVGGLAAVKSWVQTRRRAFSPEAKAFGLPHPKGILLVGCPGTGKSLIAKATASALGLPLVRLDIGAIFGGLVGESEANARTALRTIDAIAPCVCMIDELEKAFAGSGAGQSHDSGTSSRVLGSFLSWTQEHNSPVFLLATANDVTSLPPEMLRKGRWDSMMFIDLPSPEEREEIFRIHLAKRGRAPQQFDLPAFLSASDGFSGAEIEQAIIDGLFAAFAEGSELRDEHIHAALSATVPLSRTMADQIAALRDWAKLRCAPAGGSAKSSSTAQAKIGRKVD